MSYSFRSLIEGGADTDMIYYNASIISTAQNTAAQSPAPPEVKFTESRDAPIVRNASNYYFSIIRFSMNGPNKNLPLFIPIIQTNGFHYPTQTNPNLTIYYATIAYQRQWAYSQVLTAAAVTKVFTITPRSTPLIYVPETQNTAIAPVPQVPASGIIKQDLSTRYYWVYTYKHFVDLVNQTLLTAMERLFVAFQSEWLLDPDIDQALSPFPYADLAAFLADHDVPFVKYNEESKLFEIYGDTRAFNVSGQITGADDELNNPVGVQFPVPAFVAPPAPGPSTPAVATSAPFLRLFFNGNLYNLLTNFNNTYLGAGGGDSILFPLTGPTPQPLGPDNIGQAPILYTNEILFTNQNFTNILNNNPTLQGLNASPPPAYNPFFLIPATKQNLYWIAKQDYNSTNSLWSPCQAIVFTSNQLPIKNEYISKPVVLGTANTTESFNSASAFQNIVADVVIDGQTEKAEGWRDFYLYEPTAEYKMASIQASHDEIRNIDIQVFWRYRLTGELIPMTMANCSDVTIKMLFRRVDYRS